MRRAIDYWMVPTGPDDKSGINGGLMYRGFQNAINTIEVYGKDKTIVNIVDADGEVISSKTAVLGVGSMAYCRDTEGDIFGLMQPKVKLK